MKSWIKKFVVVSSALAISVAVVTPSLARPGDADTQMQVEIDQYTAKIKANPRDFGSIYERGQLYLRLGKLELCKADGLTLIELDKTSPVGYWLLSRIAKAGGDRVTGLKYIRECIAREKLNADHVHYELYCLRGLKRFQEMLTRANDLEKRLPADAELFYLRAFARAGVGQPNDLVLADLNRAKTLASGNDVLLRDIQTAISKIN